MGHPNLQLLDLQLLDFHDGLLFRIEKRGKQENYYLEILMDLQMLIYTH